MSSVQVELAPTDFNDWSALLALLQTSFAYMDGRIDPPSSLNEMTEDDLRAKAGREQLVVASEHGQLVGCAYVDVRSTCAYVGKVAVASKARGRGIAKQLLDAAESIARNAGRQVLELQTRVELLENHKAFSALGFERVAETAHPGYSRPTSITMQRAVCPRAQ
jgi:N-acetylglutamate synthase-like GNAT family acetyltransferase